VISPIPDQEVVAPDPFVVINLDDFVSDADNADSELTWTVTGETYLEVDNLDRVVTITYVPGYALSETLTFHVIDPDGLSDVTTATFTVTLAPPVDYTIPLGGSVTDTRSFTTTPENFSQVAFFTESIGTLPQGVTYTRTSFGGSSPDTFNVGFEIAVDGTATPGFHTFSVEYGLLDGGEPPNPLTPLFDNVFDFTIHITP
jgi:hypothetical protein